MRNDEVLFLDILIASQRIIQFTQGINFAQFERDEKTKSAVLREIQVIGEAARMLSEEAKRKQPQIPWGEIAGMRNRVIHEYFNVDVEVVWDVVEQDIPPLVQQLLKIVPPEQDT